MDCSEDILSPVICEASDLESKEIEVSCPKHKKNLIKPIFFCDTCYTKILCEDCLVQEHNTSDCEILRYEIVKSRYKKFAHEIRTIKLENNEAIVKEISKLQEYKNQCLIKMDSYFDNVEKKIKDFYAKKNEYLLQVTKYRSKPGSIKEKIDNYLQKDISKYITMKRAPEFFIEFDLQEIGEDDYRNPPDGLRGNLKFLSKFEHFTGCSEYFCDDGIYYFDRFTLSNSFLYFKPSFGGSTQKYELSTKIIDFKITASGIYALATKPITLMYSKKPFGSLIKFTEVVSDVFKLFAAIENEKKESYLLLVDTSGSLCFYHDNIKKWNIERVYSDIREGCILSNENCIVLDESYIVKILSKTDGDELRIIAYENISGICAVPSNAMILTVKEDNDRNEKSLFFIDKLYNQKVIYKDNIHKAIGLATTNKLLVKDERTNQIQIFKLE
ncbi:unnamed protein product [Dimorphilus gyrociliatus]|uniref:Uncharacterized protein n=1 Tax=Dimorphilus gyrociliatus TaxID=2664684 RepID=A0A7I8VEM5_9ANNE|nr:unnamed protein product [Dimorphilus gyrociliatus]